MVLPDAFPVHDVVLPSPRMAFTDAAPGRLASAATVGLRSMPGANAWQITYHSTDTHDRPNVIGGTVIIPSATRATAVVGYAVGTHGFGENCAPSRAFRDGTEGEAGFVGDYLAAGYAVAITDYDGYSHAPTFVNGRSQAHAVLDVVRAAMTIPEAGLAGLPVVLTGYSQGGHAVGWAAQLADDYAPELDLRAAAVGAPVPDFDVCEATNTGGFGAGLILISMMGLDHAYPELDLAAYLTDFGREAVAKARNQCLMELIATNMFHTVEEYVTGNMLRRSDWRKRGAEQLLGGMVPSPPVLLYHSPDDDILSYAGSVQLRDDWRRLGVDVDFRPLAGGNHLDGMATGASLAFEWITERLSESRAA